MTGNTSTAASAAAATELAPNLLRILFERSPKIVREGAEGEDIRFRPRKRMVKGFRRRPADEWLMPIGVLKALREPDGCENCAIPADVQSAVVVSRMVAESTVVNCLHVGMALRMAHVTSLRAIEKEDTQVTVEIGGKSPIGEQLCLETTPADVCFWSQFRERSGNIQTGPGGKPVMRRFVCDRVPLPTNKITLVIRYVQDQLRVIAAYYGEPSHKLPGTFKATKADQFWWFDPLTKNGHAIVVTPQLLAAKRIVKETLVQTCPW